PLIFLVGVVLGWLQIVAAHTDGGEGFFNGLLTVALTPTAAKKWEAAPPKAMSLRALFHRVKPKTPDIFVASISENR
ncbi:MAG: hypothetical protein KA969_14440, partial [Alicycliphilus sp.]|nr:hypothetical protein [Alicycliphilus sp.]